MRALLLTLTFLLGNLQPAFAAPIDELVAAAQALGNAFNKKYGPK